MRNWLVVLFLVFGVVACGTDDPPVKDGTGLDAGGNDVGVSDVGGDEDTGTVDVDMGEPDMGPVASCDDGIQNQDESDIDCGGSCSRCEIGEMCMVADDCGSVRCAEGLCAEPLRALGQVCETSDQCESGDCQMFGDMSYCTTACTDMCQGQNLACFNGQCVPDTYCDDPDNDGLGVGPGCQGSPCETCDVNATCSQDGNMFTCNCNMGFTGDGQTCADIDECATGADNCDANATCTNNPGGFGCDCDAGFAGDGVMCADIDECAMGTDNCAATASCKNIDGSFECECDPGYTGDGVTCTDIDECTDGTDNCDANASCTNTPGGFTCACAAGFSGDGTNCVDIDECSTGADNCDTNASCTNTAGGFTCACDPGYMGSGTSCSDTNECSAGTDNCDNNASCTNTQGSFTCMCNAGYQGDGVTCTDINECSMIGTCGANAQCINLAGSVTCVCNSGYEGDPMVGCTDEDECADGTDACDANASCFNTPGNYSCSCDAGYSGNGFVCSDNDECSLGTDNCDANASCTNNAGGFTCACNAGFVGDGVNCTQIGDVCGTPFTVSSLPFTYMGDTSDFSNDYSYASGACPGVPGLAGGTNAPDVVFDFTPSVSATYQIELASGFDSAIYVVTDCGDVNNSCVRAVDEVVTSRNEVLNVPLTAGVNYKIIIDGYSTGSGVVSMTVDLNECASGTANCAANTAQCTNTTSGFTCSCLSGYMGDGTSCTDIDECATGADNCDTNATCANTAGGFTCTCNAGYSGDGVTCIDLNAPGETCSNPFVVGPLPYMASGDTSDAVNDFSFPAGACAGVSFGAGGASNDEVYAFTPPANGDYVIELSNTTFDSVLYVVRDCANVGTTCEGADDAVASGGTETLNLTLVGGLTYYIVVDGFSGASNFNGPYDISVSAAP